MSFLLDTNVLSEYFRRPAGLIHRFIQHSGRLYTSSVSLSELYVWVFGRPDPRPLRSAIAAVFVEDVSVIPLDADCAEKFGHIRVDLRSRGIGVDNMDLLIAATALVFDFTLVTHNTAHFSRIPGLRLEDWHAS